MILFVTARTRSGHRRGIADCSFARRRLLLGEELTGVAVPVAQRDRHRPCRIRGRLLARRNGALRHAGLLRGRHDISHLRRLSERYFRYTTAARHRRALDTDGAFDAGTDKRYGGKNIERLVLSNTVVS